MRFLVVGSCSKKKLYSSLSQPRCHDIDEHPGIYYWNQRFRTQSAPARDMYTGPQNTQLVKSVDTLRTIPKLEVQLVIVSAGYGLVQEQDLIPPYDCSFSNMRLTEIRNRSKELELRESFTLLATKEFDLAYLALGKQYLEALGVDMLSIVKTPTIAFHGGGTDFLIRVPCSSDAVKALSQCGHKIHGVVGFKGDLLRIMAEYALEQPDPYDEVRKWTNLDHVSRLLSQLGLQGMIGG